MRQVAADPAKDPLRLLTRLVHEHDAGAAGERGRSGRDQERRRAPDVEEEPAADQSRAERDPAHDVLHALGVAEHPRRQHVRVQPAVGRLVDVVGEEECEDEERRRPQVRHERHQRQAERHGREGDHHERASAAEGRVERVAPRADHERQGDAKTPSAASTRAIIVAESVKRPRTGGR